MAKSADLEKKRKELLEQLRKERAAREPPASQRTAPEPRVKPAREAAAAPAPAPRKANAAPTPTAPSSAPASSPRKHGGPATGFRPELYDLAPSPDAKPGASRPVAGHAKPSADRAPVSVSSAVKETKEVAAARASSDLLKRVDEHVKRDPDLLPTRVTRLCTGLELAEGQRLDFGALSGLTGLDEENVEKLAKVLEEDDIVEITYPVNVFVKPFVTLKRRLAAHAERSFQGDALLSSYALEASGVPARVHVWASKAEPRPVYAIAIVHSCAYTDYVLEYLRQKLARDVPVLTEEITDPKKMAGLRERFYEAGKRLLERTLPGLRADELRVLSGLLLHKMLGLGDLELLMSDDNLEEIAVNTASEPVSVYHRKLGWLKTTLFLGSEERVYNIAAQIGRKSGRDINLTSPVMDAALLTGDRVTATLFPVSASGNTITIRRFARAPWTVVDFISPTLKTMSPEMAAWLWLAMQYELNVLVAGGTATGKTSALNTLAALIPPAHRTISVEETRELQFPSYLKWNWVPLLTRSPNPEGKGAVSMLDLMVTALRMRPDRVIVGEVRRRDEAEVLFEAMHTGHAVYSTLHADSARQVVRRLTQPPFEVPQIELEALHLVVVQYRDRRLGIRRTSEITEVIPGAGPGGEVGLNTLFKWKPRSDAFEKLNDSTRLVSELNQNTGLSLDEIRSDVKRKQRVLEWMLEHKLSDIESVGTVMKAFYKDEEGVYRAAEKNAAPSTVL